MVSSSTKITGIYDFSYAPYALGDALTWQMNLAVLAEKFGCEKVDIMLVIDPRRPYCRYQTFMNPNNYVSSIEALLSAFTCLNNIRSLKIIRDGALAQKLLFHAFRESKVTWPSFWNHVRRYVDITSHKLINEFYQKNNYLPKLRAPMGYETWATQFYQ